MDSRPTPGQLLALPDLSLFTLEDPWLDNAPNVSCIPLGTYPCAMTKSARFGRVMPQLLAVPGRGGIRIHGGNTTADTLGCPLVGITRVSDTEIRDCAPALDLFVPWLEAALAEGDVFCEVSLLGS